MTSAFENEKPLPGARFGGAEELDTGGSRGRGAVKVDALFKPKSIAVIGASGKPTIGRRLIASLDRLGFSGAVFPVNPNYETVLGRTCYPSIADLPPARRTSRVFCLGNARRARHAALSGGGGARHEGRNHL